jgi:hypothetical protein
MLRREARTAFYKHSFKEEILVEREKHFGGELDS